MVDSVKCMMATSWYNSTWLRAGGEVEDFPPAVARVIAYQDGWDVGLGCYSILWLVEGKCIQRTLGAFVSGK